MSSPFDYLTGDPDNLVGGNQAAMSDIQGPFLDLKEYLNKYVAVLPGLLAGRVVAQGAIDAGQGFTITHAQTGVYQLTVPFVLAAVLVTPAEAAATSAGTVISGTGATVTLYAPGGTVIASAWSFLAVGTP